jgi:hypothetical protein
MPKEPGFILRNDLEVRKEVTVTSIVASQTEKTPTCMLIEYHSSWNSLKRAVGWMMKLKK